MVRNQVIGSSGRGLAPGRRKKGGGRVNRKTGTGNPPGPGLVYRRVTLLRSYLVCP
jgi:hypothetical protein